MELNNWDAYRYVLAVARSGSLGCAATHLGVTEPAVGQQLEELECALGAPLFHRSTDGLTPNGSGYAVVKLATEMEARLGAIAHCAREKEKRQVRPIIITAPEGLGIHWLAKRLPLFNERHPDVDVSLSINASKVDLYRESIDVALRVGAPARTNLVGRSVGRARFGLYASERYLDARGRPTESADLKHHDVIDSYGVLGDLPHVEKFRELAEATAVRVRCDSLGAQIVAARAGAGLAVLPSYVVEDYPELSPVLPTVFGTELDVWLLAHPEFAKNPRIRAVFDWLMSEIADDSTINVTSH